MKIIGISTVIVFSLALSACQPPTGNEKEATGGGTEEATGEERLEEPQVRDGVPETSLRDSLAIDTADTADTL